MLLMWNVSACLCIKEEWSVQKLSLNSLQRVQDNGAVNRNEMVDFSLSVHNLNRNTREDAKKRQKKMNSRVPCKDVTNTVKSMDTLPQDI